MLLRPLSFLLAIVSSYHSEKRVQKICHWSCNDDNLSYPGQRKKQQLAFKVQKVQEPLLSSMIRVFCPDHGSSKHSLY